MRPARFYDWNLPIVVYHRAEGQPEARFEWIMKHNLLRRRDIIFSRVFCIERPPQAISNEGWILGLSSVLLLRDERATIFIACNYIRNCPTNTKRPQEYAKQTCRNTMIYIEKMRRYTSLRMHRAGILPRVTPLAFPAVLTARARIYARIAKATLLPFLAFIPDTPSGTETRTKERKRRTALGRPNPMINYFFHHLYRFYHASILYSRSC